MKKLNVILILLTGLWFTGCGNGNDARQPEDELVKTVNVETETLQPQRFTSYVELVGTVEALNDARLSSEANGVVKKYYVDEGEKVKKGQAIAKIDDEQLVKERERLEAVTNQARENYQRQKRIWEEDSIGSEIQYLNAKYNYEQNKAALASVNVQIEKATLRAPFDGVVETKLVEEGEMASMGTPLVRLLGTDYVKVTVGVPARYSDVVQADDSAQVWFNTQQSDTLEGSITYISNSIDAQTRTFRIEIAIPNRKQKYKIEMLANVKLRTMDRSNEIVVSQEYIYQKDRGYVAYVAGQDENGEPIAREQLVKMGPSFSNKVIVEDGLKAGDPFITVGSSYLQPNTRIQIVNQKQALAD